MGSYVSDVKSIWGSWHNSRGMENPPNSVVNSLGFREGLVSALVGCQNQNQKSINQLEKQRFGNFHVPMTQRPVPTNPAQNV